MCFADATHDRQPQAAALGITAGERGAGGIGDTVKAFEHPLPLRRRNAGSGIDDGKRYPGRVALEADVDLPPAGV